MRYLFLIMSLIIILAGARLGFCDWEYMIQVNTDNYDKQASRGVVDCPWPIASDAYGNVYTVWEDKRDPEEDPELNIYFRKKNADGTWEEDDYRVSFEEGRLYGHPSICVLPIGEEPPLLACYVGEDTRELRGNTYYEGEWGDPSYFISDEGGYLLTFSSSGWGTNIVALSDGKAYAFWQYIDGSSVKLYHNIYDDGWVTEYEKTVYDDGGADPHYSRHENARVDGDDKIHLVYADNYSGNNEIYYLYKGAQDDDFGYYPGCQISSSPANSHSVFPYCAVSEVVDTTFLHVVWSTLPTALIYYRNWNSVTSSWSATTDTIVQYIITRAEKPSVACDSYGNVHVVWQENLEDGSYDVVKYRKFDYALGEWGTIITLPADEEEIDVYGMPVIISDVYDNLHVLMTGRRVGVEATDEEVYYSFWDAPPHIWDLTFLQNQSNQDSVVIDWEGMDEPDLDTYKVYRKFEDGQWEHVGSTTDTRYADTTASYFIICGDDDITKYYVEAVDDASQSAYTDTLEIWCVENAKMYAGNMAELIDLGDNYPNPFNAQTTMEYNVPYDMQITLEIYDILGRKVETLISGFRSAGSYAVTWDASDIASGMYFYRFQAGEYSATKRMTILK